MTRSTLEPTRLVVIQTHRLSTARVEKVIPCPIFVGQVSKIS